MVWLIGRFWRWLRAPFKRNDVFILIVVATFIFKFCHEMKQLNENYDACLADFLKDKNLLDDDFKVKAYNGSLVLCQIAVNMHVFGLMSSLDSHLKDRNFTESESESDCVLDKVNDSPFLEVFLKQSLYNMTTSTIIPKETLNRKENVEPSLNKQLNDILLQCKDRKAERMYFDHIYNVARNWTLLEGEWKLVKDYCLKTYLKSNKLIQSDFDLTPIVQLPMILQSFCYYEVLAPIKGVIESSFWNWDNEMEILSYAEKLCASIQIEKHGVVEKLTAVAIASSFGVNQQEKAIEYKDYERIRLLALTAVAEKCRKII